MKILLAPDSFKGSLSAKEVCNHMKRGFLSADPTVEVIALPLSDGGEGIMDSILLAKSGQRIQCQVEDPLGRPIMAHYAQLEDQTACIEFAEASGLPLVKTEERDPKLASSFGTGQLIAHALDAGNKKLIIGLGGSATNDGAAGIIMALGGKFFDSEGNLLPKGGEHLSQLRNIDLSSIHPGVKNCKFQVGCDVNNPLTGATGATYTYGPQKGASTNDLDILEYALINYAVQIQKCCRIDVLNLKGGGAAGGAAAGLVAFLEAQLMSGFEMIAELLDLEQKIMESDLIVTGEGKLDDQSFYGKVPVSVARMAKKHGKPVIAIAGTVTANLENLEKEGFAAVYNLIEKAGSLEAALKNAGEVMETLSAEVLLSFQ